MECVPNFDSKNMFWILVDCNIGCCLALSQAEFFVKRAESIFGCCHIGLTINDFIDFIDFILIQLDENELADILFRNLL